MTLLRSTRALLAAGVALTAGTGAGLWLLPGRTEDYWAWPIRAPLSAAFLGAGFAGAAVSLGLALARCRPPAARTVLAAAATLTALSLAVTVRHRDDLRFEDGASLPGLVAWTWLVVYVALPPLAVAALAAETRRGIAAPGRLPLLPGERALLAGAGALLAAGGAALLAEWDGALDAWPWPLAPLPGALVGAWLCSSAASLLWGALLEPDWDALDPSAAGAAVFGALLLGAVARLPDGLDGTAPGLAYIAAVAASLGLLGTLRLAAARRAEGGGPAAANLDP